MAPLPLFPATPLSTPHSLLLFLSSYCGYSSPFSCYASFNLSLVAVVIVLFLLLFLVFPLLLTRLLMRFRPSLLLLLWWCGSRGLTHPVFAVLSKTWHAQHRGGLLGAHKFSPPHTACPALVCLPRLGSLCLALPFFSLYILFFFSFPFTLSLSFIFFCPRLTSSAARTVYR